MSETLRPFCDEVICVFGPLVDAARTPATLLDTLSDLGWELSSAPAPLSDLATAGADLIDAIGAETISVTDIIASIKRLIDAVSAIAAAPDTAFPADIDVAT